MNMSLIERLRVIAKAISEEDWRELSMRVPAEPERDADLVVMKAADLLEQQAERIKELEAERDGWREDANVSRNSIAMLKDRCNHFEDTLAALRKRIDDAPVVAWMGEYNINNIRDHYTVVMRNKTDSDRMPERVRPLYTHPQPAIPDGWLRAVDEAMVCSHLGVADASDSYEVAKKKLNDLICWNVQVATDPAVNGGRQLVPVEPTEAMLDAGEMIDGDGVTYVDLFKAMLAAAPKPENSHE